MKDRTKYILFAVFVLFAFQTYSQTYRVKGGVNLSDFLYKSEGVNYSNLYNITSPGFHAGASMENQISHGLSFETGLFVSLKGLTIDALNNVYSYGGKLNLFYLDVPLTLKTTFGRRGATQWFLAGGPWFDIGFAGNVMALYNWAGDGQAVKEKVKWGSGEGEVKRFDIGVTVGGGIEFGDWEVGAFYDHGFPELLNGTVHSLKTRVWKISVGYTLGY